MLKLMQRLARAVVRTERLARATAEGYAAVAGAMLSGCVTIRRYDDNHWMVGSRLAGHPGGVERGKERHDGWLG